MSDEPFELAASFAAARYSDWLEAAEKATKRSDPEQALATRTYEGFALKPLYTGERDGGTPDPAGLPGLAPFTRGADAAGRTAGGWDIRQTLTHPDLAESNAALREDLANGVHSLAVQLDLAARTGDDGKLAEDGLPLHSVELWLRLLADVEPQATPLALHAGAAFLPAAAMLAAAGGPAPGTRLGADPFGTLASHGALPQGVEQGLADMADLAHFATREWPQVASVAVDGAAYDDAGASESQTLAAMMATGVAYLRAMTEAGLTADDACAQIVFRLPLGHDQFMAIAKQRAARKLWSRIAEVSGAIPEARAARIDAVTANRNLAERDPYTNLLRTTLACFAAAVGGADSITVAPYDAVLGPVSDDFARRIARNTQLLLREESNLHRVMDPGGGAWFLEDLTQKLAQSAWALFQEIEAAGGIADALTGGLVAGKIEATWQARQQNLAHRRDPLTGVSEFPDIAEKLPDVPEPDPAQIRESLQPGLQTQPVDLPPAGSGERTAAAIAAAKDGASLDALLNAAGGSATQCEAMPRRRFGEAFEAMREESDRRAERNGQRPAVFLANLGPLATYSARAMFARNAFEAGGLKALDNGGHTDPDALAEAFRAADTPLAVLCSSDRLYRDQAEAMAKALKAAGCRWLALAGDPGDARESYEAAGVDDFIAVGSDLLATLRRAWAALGA